MKRMTMGRLLWLPLVALAFGYFVPPALHAAEKAKFGGTMVVSMPVDPFSLNPILNTSIHTAYVTGQIYNRLVRADWDGSLLPELAERWSVSKDGLAYTFNLAKNILWHDGKPFTSEDVKFSFEAIMKYHPSGAMIWKPIEKIETPDPHTVVFRLKFVSAGFKDLLYQTSFTSIIPKHIYEGSDVATNPHNANNPVGTGPWMLKEWVKGSHVTLVRNPQYFKKEMPYLDRLIFKIYADPSSQLTAFEAGDIDYMPWNVPLHEAARLQKDPNLVVKSFSTGNQMTHVIGMNLQKPYLKDVRVRRALAHAIDKEFLLKTVEYGFGKVKNSIVSDSPLMAWCYNPDVPRYAFDLKRAEKLLDEAGFPKKNDGVRFEISIVNTFADPTVVKNTEIIRDWLKQIGVRLKIETMDTATGFDRVFNRWDYDLFYYMVYTGPDPQIQIRRFFHSDNIRHAAALANTGGYRNPKVDESFDNAAKSADRNEQAKYYKQFQKLVMEDLPYIPLYESYFVQVFRKELKGLPVGFMACTEAMDTVWSEKGKEKR
jgi:peptide/nickel transport system substrate-binding protein